MSRWIRIIGLFGILALVTACTRNEPNALPTSFAFVTATHIPSSTPEVPTATALPSPTLRTATATASPEPAFTFTPEPSATSSPTPQFTPTVLGVCSHHPSGIFRDLYQSDPGLPLSLGCPTFPEDDLKPQMWQVGIRYQPFERGLMLGLSNLGWFEDSRVVYALYDDGQAVRFEDSYVPPLEGIDPEDITPQPIESLTAPEGLFLPTGGLAVIWLEGERVQELLGYALEEQVIESSLMQMFQAGEMIWVPHINKIITIKRGEPTTWVIYTVQ